MFGDQAPRTTPHDSAADGTTERACYFGGRHDGAWGAALEKTENRAISCQNVTNVSFAAENRRPPNAGFVPNIVGNGRNT